MFTIDNVVEQSVKTAKIWTAYVQDLKVRQDLEGMIDAQADYTKTMFNLTSSLGKNISEKAKTFAK